jgi:hypothetical protein
VQLQAQSERLQRLDGWVASQAGLLSQLAQELEQARAGTAAREAELGNRLESIERATHLQGAITSAVQRMAQVELRQARAALETANAIKEDFEHILPDLLNGATLSEARSKTMRQDVASFGAALQELGSRAAAVRHHVGENERTLAAVREELWSRAGALEGELASRVVYLDEARARLTTIENRTMALSLEGHSDLEFAVKSLRDELWARTGAVQGELAKRSQQLDEVSLRLEALAGKANLAEMSATLANLSESIQYLTSRIEFVRRETLFEVRYGAGEGHAAKRSTEPRIIDAAKLKKLASSLKVNVGCGHIALEGYVNVDRRELPGVDVVAEANNMPFAANSVAELFAAHLMEHFPQEQLRREILPYWKGLLKPRGKLRAVVPDADAMIREFAAGRYGYADLREVTFGGQDYEGDFHYNMFTPESLSALLREAGFAKVEVTERGRRNGACFEFEIVAS